MIILVPLVTACARLRSVNNCSSLLVSADSNQSRPESEASQLASSGRRLHFGFWNQWIGSTSNVPPPPHNTLNFPPWLGANGVVQMQTSRSVPNGAPPAHPDKGR